MPILVEVASGQKRILRTEVKQGCVGIDIVHARGDPLYRE